MKLTYAVRLFGAFLAAMVLMAGCGESPPPENSQEEESSEISSEISEPVIGNDWRSIRGYSQEVYHLFGRETLISLISGGNQLGYTFYDAEDGTPMATLLIQGGWTSEDMDKDRYYTLYEKDFNNDGFCEFGVPMKDDRVFWYQYVNPNGFTFWSEGTPEGPDGPFPACVGAGLSPAYALTEDFSIRFSYYEEETSAGYYVLDETGVEVVGVLEVPGGQDADGLDRTGDNNFIVEDRDGDGIAEIGLPLLNGSILWFAYEEEREDFEMLSEYSDAPEEEEAYSMLTEFLGDQMEGKTLSTAGTRNVNGTVCRLFFFGTDSEEGFTGEKLFAVDAEGNVYAADGADGAEFQLYQP